MLASRAVIERIVAAETTAYGVNTGFGDLAEVRISPDQIRTLQVNLVRSHACGVGVPLSDTETRALMLLRATPTFGRLPVIPAMTFKTTREPLADGSISVT